MAEFDPRDLVQHWFPASTVGGVQPDFEAYDRWTLREDHRGETDYMHVADLWVRKNGGYLHWSDGSASDPRYYLLPVNLIGRPDDGPENGP